MELRHTVMRGRRALLFCENGDRDGVGKNRGQLPCGSGHAINLENQGNGLTQGKGEVMK